MLPNSTDNQESPGRRDKDRGAPPVIRRLLENPSRLVLAASIAGLLLLFLTYVLWPRHKASTATGDVHSVSGEASAGEDHERHPEEGSVEIPDETAELVGIKSEPVASGEAEDSIAAVGWALSPPSGQAIVGARVDGRVLRVLVEPGQTVKAGQTVAIIDSPLVAELRGQLAEAQARLSLAEQNLARTEKAENRAAAIQARNKLDFAESNLERKRRLTALGAAAGRELAEAEVEYKNAKAEYDYVSAIQVTREQQQARSETEQSRAAVARLIQSLDALGAGKSGRGGTVTITSPIDGSVVDRHISVGQSVAQGAELMTVLNLSSVIIEAQLPESQAVQVRTGQRITARIPGLPDRVIDGRVESVGTAVDPQKRTVPVRARVTNTGGLLKHEMAVEVRITTNVRREGLLVPVSAIVEDEGVTIVYVKESNRYERRPVRVGAINYKLAEILSGVQAGEEVVIAGAYQIKNLQRHGGEGGEHHDEH